MGNKGEILARQYAAKIVEVAYYEVMPNKETITNVLEALIKEYSDQQNKELLARVDELEKVIKKLDDWSYDCRLATYPKSEVQSVINKNK